MSGLSGQHLVRLVEIGARQEAVVDRRSDGNAGAAS
jgi:hypothetical protein